MWFFLAATIMQAFAQRRQTQAQVAEAEFERKEAIANAARAAADEKLSAQIAEAEGVESLLEGEQAKATAQVGAAARGGRGDVGTNFILSLQNAAVAEWETFKTNLSGRRRTERFGAEKTSFLRQAGQLKARKINIESAGRLAMASTILGGLGQASLMSGRSNQPNFSTTTANSGVLPPSSIVSGNRFGS